MMFLFFVLCLFYALPAFAHQAVVPLIEVSDGDTFKVLLHGETTSVRLKDIDCFETRRSKRAYFQEKYYQKPLNEVIRQGKESEQKLQELLSKTKEIRVEWEKRDGFCRILGQVCADNIHVNAYMLEYGGCKAYLPLK
ncbi:MAG: thermonuclease family protein [Alphaproteobacteria bacterium]|nr:thermonuclease family protein [Alphaproteobacteria bacterium]